MALVKLSKCFQLLLRLSSPQLADLFFEASKLHCSGSRLPGRKLFSLFGFPVLLASLAGRTRWPLTQFLGLQPPLRPPPVSVFKPPVGWWWAGRPATIVWWVVRPPSRPTGVQPTLPLNTGSPIPTFAGKFSKYFEHFRRSLVLRGLTLTTMNTDGGHDTNNENQIHQVLDDENR